MAEKLTWHGSKLLSRQTPRWGQDKTYPTMWRVRLLDGSGSLSDMVNRTRVKDVRRCAVEARHAVVAATHEAAPHSVEQRSKRPTAWLGWEDSNSEIVDANYLFERSHRFAGIQPNSGFGDSAALGIRAGMLARATPAELLQAASPLNV
jgi:hypothetical protein